MALPAPQRQRASPEPPATAVLLKAQWHSFLTEKGIYTQIRGALSLPGSRLKQGIQASCAFPAAGRLVAETLGRPSHGMRRGRLWPYGGVGPPGPRVEASIGGLTSCRVWQVIPLAVLLWPSPDGYRAGGAGLGPAPAL